MRLVRLVSDGGTGWCLLLPSLFSSASKILTSMGPSVRSWVTWMVFSMVSTRKFKWFSFSFNSYCFHVVESSNKSLGPVYSWVLGFHSSCFWESSSRLCWRLTFSLKLSSMIFFWKYWMLFSDVFLHQLVGLVRSWCLYKVPFAEGEPHSQPMKWRLRGLIFLSFLQEPFHDNVLRFLFSATKQFVTGVNWPNNRYLECFFVGLYCQSSLLLDSSMVFIPVRNKAQLSFSS